MNSTLPDTPHTGFRTLAGLAGVGAFLLTCWWIAVQWTSEHIEFYYSYFPGTFSHDAIRLLLLLPGIIDVVLAMCAVGLAFALMNSRGAHRGSPAMVAFLIFLALAVATWDKNVLLSPAGAFDKTGLGSYANPLIVVAFMALVRFSALFPRELGPHQLEPVQRRTNLHPQRLVRYLQRVSMDARRFVVAGVALTLTFLSLAISTPLPSGYSDTIRISGWFNVPFRDVYWFIGGWALNVGQMWAGITIAAFVLVLLCTISAATRNLAIGAKKGSESDRIQALHVYRGLTAGGAVLLVGATYTFVEWLFPRVRFLPGWINYLSPGHLVVGIALLVMVLLLGYSTFRHGSLDPSLIIRRTALYSVFGSLIVFCFGVVQHLALDHVSARFGLSDDVTTWFAAGSVAAILTPLRKRIGIRTNLVLDSTMPLTALASAPRRRSVIVFSDLVGYSRLSVTDADTALTYVMILDRTSQQVTRTHGGRVVKTLGDGVMLEFGNANSATTAAIQLHNVMREEGAKASLPLATLRTGIHVGDVAVRQDGDLFGEVVNLAARLQTAAEPGQLLITEEVVRLLDTGVYSVDDVGERHLKNIPDPVRCFAVEVIGVGSTTNRS